MKSVTGRTGIHKQSAGRIEKQDRRQRNGADGFAGKPPDTLYKPTDGSGDLDYSGAQQAEPSKKMDLKFQAIKPKY